MLEVEEDEGLWEAEGVAGVGAEVERGGGGGVGAVRVQLGEEVGVNRGGAETINNKSILKKLFFEGKSIGSIKKLYFLHLYVHLASILEDIIDVFARKWNKNSYHLAKGMLLQFTTGVFT